MVSGYTLGNFIYVLLVIAIVLFLVRLISGVGLNARGLTCVRASVTAGRAHDGHAAEARGGGEAPLRQVNGSPRTRRRARRRSPG
jgi:hypothetical protein